MSRQPRERTETRLATDEGAVLVEAAIVLPILLLIFLGIFDFGVGWRQSRIMSSGLGNAARQLASSQNARNADLYALQSFMATMNDTEATEVDKVVIYRATSSGQPTNSSCLTMSTSTTVRGVTGACNVYGTSQVTTGLTATNFGNATDTTCTSTQFDKFWCPTSRNVNQGSPPDFIGVYAEATFTPISSVWGSSYTFTDRVVTQIEPKVV